MATALVRFSDIGSVFGGEGAASHSLADVGPGRFRHLAASITPRYWSCVVTALGIATFRGVYVVLFSHQDLGLIRDDFKDLENEHGWTVLQPSPLKVDRVMFFGAELSAMQGPTLLLVDGGPNIDFAIVLVANSIDSHNFQNSSPRGSEPHHRAY